MIESILLFYQDNTEEINQAVLIYGAITACFYTLKDWLPVLRTYFLSAFVLLHMVIAFLHGSAPHFLLLKSVQNNTNFMHGNEGLLDQILHAVSTNFPIIIIQISLLDLLYYAMSGILALGIGAPFVIAKTYYPVYLMLFLEDIVRFIVPKLWTLCGAKQTQYHCFHFFFHTSACCVMMLSLYCVNQSYRDLSACCLVILLEYLMYYLQQQELAKIMNEIPHHKFVKYFNCIDLNHDGKLDRTEFARWIFSLQSDGTRRRQQLAYGNRVPLLFDTLFDKVDTNKDGHISCDEAYAYFKELYFHRKRAKGYLQLIQNK